MKSSFFNFLNIKQENFKDAKIVIVPCPYESTTCYGKGTKNGPKAIIYASSQVELFDEELWQETYKKIKIITIPEIKFSNLKPKTVSNQIQKIIQPIIFNNKLPIVIGGEHSITPFIMSVYSRFLKDSFSILQFDAHADLRDDYLGQKYSHASAMRRCLDLDDINLVQVGIRNISQENDELNFWQNNQFRIKTFWAKDKNKWKIKDILKSLSPLVYLTFDVDVFDSSIMPSVGTPEPGGLFWDETIKILKEIISQRKLIGVDVIEFMPISGFFAPDFLVAKLIYKIIGFISQSKF